MTILISTKIAETAGIVTALTPDSRPVTLDLETDRILVGLAITGDEAAFATLMHRYRPLMHAHAVRLLRSNAEADDVVQESFIAAWTKLATINDPDRIKTWLMTVVRNKSIDKLRSRQDLAYPLDYDLPATTASPAKIVETLLENQALSEAVARLPMGQRRSWLMRELGGCSYAVIAAELGVPISTVRGMLARAREKLAREMAAWR